MTNVRMLVMRKPADNLPRNRVVNVVHFNVTPDLDPFAPDWDTLAQDTAEVFASTQPTLEGFTGFEVRAYALSDSLPRPPRGTGDTTQAGTGSAIGPREVALCLSFFHERNIKRQRGRLYLGPIPKVYCDERPQSSATGYATALAEGLEGVGGVNVDWSIWSPTDSAMRKVTNWWVDDEWDTQRSRGLRSTTRASGTTSE